MPDTDYRAVMFDLDGTLLDTAPDFIVALNRQRREHRLSPLADALIRRSVSNGAAALVTLGFGVGPEEEGFTDLRERLLELYMQSIAEHTRPFDGIGETIDMLRARGLGWGIATNKPELYTRALLEKLTPPMDPDIVICPDHVTHRKPDPESLILAANHFGCPAEAILYLGDHQRDIDCGRRAGATTIACAYGYIDQDDSAARWQADYLVEHSQDLPELIEKLIN